MRHNLAILSAHDYDHAHRHVYQAYEHTGLSPEGSAYLAAWRRSVAPVLESGRARSEYSNRIS
jgi:hypothetical protein